MTQPMPAPETPGATRRAIPTALIIAGLLLLAANLRAAITTVGPVLTTMEHELGLTSVAASALVSLPLLAFAVISPIAPGMARRLGLERSVTLALALLAVGLVVRSVPPSLLLWVGTALMGIAIAVLNVLLPALVKRDFPTRIGQITGAYSAVQSSFAAIAAGIAVPVASASVLGWRLPLGMWAGLAVIAIGVMAPMLRGGRGAAGGTVGEAAAGAAGSATAPRPARSPWGSALAWQVTFFMGLQSTVFYVLVTWLPSIEASAGIDEASAGLHQFLLNAFAIIGSLVCSALLARLRDQRLLGIAIPVMMLVGTAGFTFAPAASGVWASVCGVAGGGGIVLALSLFGLRTESHTDAASLSGMAQCFGYILAAAGPVLVGALHDATGSWAPALVTLAVVQVGMVISGYLAGRDRILHRASARHDSNEQTSHRSGEGAVG